MLTTYQRFVVALGLTALFAVVLYPPWAFALHTDTAAQYQAGPLSSILDPPTLNPESDAWDMHVDYSRLALLASAVVFATAALLVVAPARRPPTNPPA